MKINKLFLVHTTIDVGSANFQQQYPFRIRDDNNKITSYNRSCFSPEERIRQIISTILCIKNTNPNDRIVILDSSRNAKDFANRFNMFDNLEFIDSADCSEEDAIISQTAENAGISATIQLASYFRKFNKEIKELYDFVVIVTGRYGFYNMDTSIFSKENTNKIIFKKVDDGNREGMFLQLSSWTLNFLYSKNDIEPNCRNAQLWAFGIDYLERILDTLDAISYLLSHPKLKYRCFFEEFLYYLTLPYVENIIEVNWTIIGWSGKGWGFSYG